MSLYDEASLVMIPSGYKDDKLYSIKPTSGDGDFTFSRDGSGASPATRVNSAGLIEKGRTNLLTYSNTFSNADWVKLGNGTGSTAVVTSGFSDPDGGSNAWRLQCDLNGGTTSSDQSLIYQLGSATGVFAFSYYVKSNTGADQDFAFGNGLAGGNFTTATATTSWQRFDVFFNCTVNNTSFIGARGTMGTDDTLDILIYAAQLEKGLVATSYIETTTAAASAGILGDMPRLDYSGGASCPSLLLEPSRTNLILHSEYTDGTNWSNEGAITDEENTSETTSPEGVYNAVKLVSANATSEQWLQATGISVTSGNDYTLSCFVKKSDYDYFHIRFTGIGSAFSAGSVWFNIAEGSVGTTESGIVADIEDYGNGWYRIWATKEATATAFAGVRFQLASSDNTSAVVGDGSKGTYVYGFQAEVGSYATSYIPTYGSATARAQEGAQVTSVSDLIGQTQGTLFAEVDSFGVGEVANRILGISNGTGAERVIMLTRSNGFRFIMSNGAVNNPDYTNYTSTDGVHKLAITYDANEVRIFVDGVKVHTDTSVTLPSSLNSVHIGKAEINGNYGNNFGGSAKQALVFDSALTDAECISLTTI